MTTNNAINLTLSGIVKYDGAGTFSADTTTLNGVLVGAASNGITSLTVGTDGQVLLGHSGNPPVFATVTGTGGITLTTGPGSLVINGTGGGMNWTSITSNVTTIAASAGYFITSGTLTLTLPTTAPEGMIFAVSLAGGTSWQILQNNAPSQQIQFGNKITTAGNTGSLTSTQVGDTVTCVCLTTNTVWQVISSIGNITIV